MLKIDNSIKNTIAKHSTYVMVLYLIKHTNKQIKIFKQWNGKRQSSAVSSFKFMHSNFSKKNSQYP